MAALHISVVVSCVIQLFSVTHSAVFLQKPEANSLLHRERRANSGLEELKRGSIQRECQEEVCSYEEAREVFENDDRTEPCFVHVSRRRSKLFNCDVQIVPLDCRVVKMLFWNTYKEGDQCASNPCQNGGTCQDEFQRYLCICTEKFEGWNCEIEKTTRVECIFENGYCEQFCSDVVNSSRECHCTEDYSLGEDGKSCIAKVPYPCGKVPVLIKQMNMSNESERRGRIVGGSNTFKGEYPWQVLLTYKQKMTCGAVLLSPQWVVTASHCVHGKQRELFQIVAGEHILNKDEGSEQERNISRLILHENYDKTSVDNDIALLKLDAAVVLDDYAVPICLPEPDFALRQLSQIRCSMVSGWGKRSEFGKPAETLQKLRVPLVRMSKCRETSRFNITENMFCAGYQKAGKDSCGGDSGGPHVTLYKGNWFLTGIVSWGEGCARENKYGIYTKVYKYVHWIRQYMNQDSPTTKPEITGNQTESMKSITNITNV